MYCSLLSFMHFHLPISMSVIDISLHMDGHESFLLVSSSGLKLPWSPHSHVQKDINAPTLFTHQSEQHV